LRQQVTVLSVWVHSAPFKANEPEPYLYAAVEAQPEANITAGMAAMNGMDTLTEPRGSKNRMGPSMVGCHAISDQAAKTINPAEVITLHGVGLSTRSTGLP
jgi:hypothetical protein